jgi:EpsI family protein
MEPRRTIDLLGSKKLEDVIPSRLGRWNFYSKSGLVIPPEDDLSRQLYSQLLTRVYIAPDQPPMMLLVAQSASQTGVLQVHRPEVCYPASGYQLSRPERHQVVTNAGPLSTVFFTASADTRTEQLVYWTRVGRDLPNTWAEQRWSVARSNLRGEIPDAVLVRISTILPTSEEAIPALNEFARSLVEASPPPLRYFLTGQA